MRFIKLQKNEERKTCCVGEVNQEAGHVVNEVDSKAEGHAVEERLNKNL